MGLSGISPGSLLLLLVILLLLFGTDRIKNIGADLANAFKSFRQAMQEDDITTIGNKDNKKNSQQDNVDSNKNL